MERGGHRRLSRKHLPLERPVARMTPAPIWRLAPGQRLLYRCWDGECVLYNDLSGDTHLLDEFALALLEQVQRAPQAAAQLAAAFGLDPDADLAAGTDAPHARLSGAGGRHTRRFRRAAAPPTWPAAPGQAPGLFPLRRHGAVPAAAAGPALPDVRVGDELVRLEPRPLLAGDPRRGGREGGRRRDPAGPAGLR
jgi:PqqD family protein of HPr-rel-A system